MDINARVRHYAIRGAFASGQGAVYEEVATAGLDPYGMPRPKFQSRHGWWQRDKYKARGDTFNGNIYHLRNDPKQKGIIDITEKPNYRFETGDFRTSTNPKDWTDKGGGLGTSEPSSGGWDLLQTSDVTNSPDTDAAGSGTSGQCYLWSARNSEAKRWGATFGIDKSRTVNNDWIAHWHCVDGIKFAYDTGRCDELSPGPKIEMIYLLYADKGEVKFGPIINKLNKHGSGRDTYNRSYYVGNPATHVNRSTAFKRLDDAGTMESREDIARYNQGPDIDHEAGHGMVSVAGIFRGSLSEADSKYVRDNNLMCCGLFIAGQNAAVPYQGIIGDSAGYKWMWNMYDFGLFASWEMGKSDHSVMTMRERHKLKNTGRSDLGLGTPAYNGTKSKHWFTDELQLANIESSKYS